MWSVAVGGRVEGEEAEEAALEVGQFGDQHLRAALAIGECVTLDTGKQVDHAASGWTATRAALGIERQRVDLFVLHRLTQLAFDQRLASGPKTLTKGK